MNVLLISPQRSVSKDQPYSPLGLISIGAVLIQNGYNVKIYDREISATPLNEIMKSFMPDVVGISVYTGSMLSDALFVSKKIKENYNSKVIWGGVHPTLLPEETLKNEWIDFVIVGEGEYAMLNLLNELEKGIPLFEQLNGVAYKTEESIRVNPPNSFIDLNTLPIPAWDLLDVKKYYQNWAGCKKLLRMYSSKGCPGKCGFCYNNAYHKSKWRGRNIENLIQEIKYLIDNHDIDGVGFTDDLFTADIDRLVEFCHELVERKIVIRWFCNARVGLNKFTLQMMKMAGCECIYFGIESGSPQMLKFINKGINVNKIKETFKLCKEVGIETVGSFMLGFPTETEMDVRETINLAIELNPTYFDFSLFMCYPGTKLYDFCTKEKIFEAPKSLEEWAKIASWDKASRNFSTIPQKELQIINDFFTLKNIVKSIQHDRNTISGYFKLKAFVSAVKDVSVMLFHLVLNRQIKVKYGLRLFN